jgi:phosphoribosylanthranilate isomerase
MRIRVKICGITNLLDAKTAEKEGADALGFVFYKKSPRYIKPEDAKKIIDRLSPFTTTVGIFVNEKKKKVREIASFCNLDVLQFHGTETPLYCASFKDYKTIKAFRIKEKRDLKEIKKYNTDAILLDAYSSDRFGGTGKTFNWRLIKNLKLNKPIILSGGLTPENVIAAVRLTKIYTLDISSGIEKSFGRKDHRRLSYFFNQLKDIEG